MKIKLERRNVTKCTIGSSISRVWCRNGIHCFSSSSRSYQNQISRFAPSFALRLLTILQSIPCVILKKDPCWVVLWDHSRPSCQKKVSGEDSTEDSHQVWQGQPSVGDCILDGKMDGEWAHVYKRMIRYSMIKKYMTKDKEGKLSPIQHLTASAEAGKHLSLSNNRFILHPRRIDRTRGKSTLGDQDTYVHNNTIYIGWIQGTDRWFKKIVWWRRHPRSLQGIGTRSLWCLTRCDSIHGVWRDEEEKERVETTKGHHLSWWTQCKTKSNRIFSHGSDIQSDCCCFHLSLSSIKE